MSHNRTTDYSPPYRRNNLLSLHQYAASDQFHALGRWDRARAEDLYVVRGTEARTQPVHIVVVASISSDKACLQPHGNYDPTYMTIEQMGRRAKLQFVLTCPEEDPEFSSDYTLALQRLRAIQDEIAGSPGRKEHFIEGNNLKMNYYLFHEKDPAPSDDAYEAGSETGDFDLDEDTELEPVNYQVSSAYKTAWETVSHTHHNNIMEVYGTDEKPVDYKQFEKRLASGTLVVVTFTLKHFAIRERGSSQVVSDTYCASVESVSILKDATKTVRKTTRAVPARRPVPVSQGSSRSTLQIAADTFAPVGHPPVERTVRKTAALSETSRENASVQDMAQDQSRVSRPNQPVDLHRNVVPGQHSVSTALAHGTFTPTAELLDSLMPFFMERLQKSAASSSRKASADPARLLGARSSTRVASNISKGDSCRSLEPVLEETLLDRQGQSISEDQDSRVVDDDDSWVKVPPASDFVDDRHLMDDYEDLAILNRIPGTLPASDEQLLPLQPHIDNVESSAQNQQSLAGQLRGKPVTPSKRGPGRPSKPSKKQKT